MLVVVKILSVPQTSMRKTTPSKCLSKFRFTSDPHLSTFTSKQMATAKLSRLPISTLLTSGFIPSMVTVLNGGNQLTKNTFTAALLKSNTTKMINYQIPINWYTKLKMIIWTSLMSKIDFLQPVGRTYFQSLAMKYCSSSSLCSQSSTIFSVYRCSMRHDRILQDQETQTHSHLNHTAQQP